MIESIYEIGMVMTQKAMGIKMCIRDFTDTAIICDWLSEQGKPHREVFKIEELQPE